MASGPTSARHAKQDSLGAASLASSPASLAVSHGSSGHLATARRSLSLASSVPEPAVLHGHFGRALLESVAELSHGVSEALNCLQSCLLPIADQYQSSAGPFAPFGYGGYAAGPSSSSSAGHPSAQSLLAGLPQQTPSNQHYRQSSGSLGFLSSLRLGDTAGGAYSPSSLAASQFQGDDRSLVDPTRPQQVITATKFVFNSVMDAIDFVRMTLIVTGGSVQSARYRQGSDAGSQDMAFDIMRRKEAIKARMKMVTDRLMAAVLSVKEVVLLLSPAGVTYHHLNPGSGGVASATAASAAAAAAAATAAALLNASPLGGSLNSSAASSASSSFSVPSPPSHQQAPSGPAAVEPFYEPAPASPSSGAPPGPSLRSLSSPLSSHSSLRSGSGRTHRAIPKFPNEGVAPIATGAVAGNTRPESPSASAPSSPTSRRAAHRRAPSSTDDSSSLFAQVALLVQRVRAELMLIDSEYRSLSGELMLMVESYYADPESDPTLAESFYLLLDQSDTDRDWRECFYDWKSRLEQLVDDSKQKLFEFLNFTFYVGPSGGQDADPDGIKTKAAEAVRSLSWLCDSCHWFVLSMYKTSNAGALGDHAGGEDSDEFESTGPLSSSSTHGHPGARRSPLSRSLASFLFSQGPGSIQRAVDELVENAFRLAFEAHSQARTKQFPKRGVSADGEPLPKSNLEAAAVELMSGVKFLVEILEHVRSEVDSESHDLQGDGEPLSASDASASRTNSVAWSITFSDGSVVYPPSRGSVTDTLMRGATDSWYPEDQEAADEEAFSEDVSGRRISNVMTGSGYRSLMMSAKSSRPPSAATMSAPLSPVILPSSLTSSRSLENLSTSSSQDLLTLSSVQFGAGSAKASYQQQMPYAQLQPTMVVGGSSSKAPPSTLSAPTPALISPPAEPSARSSNPEIFAAEPTAAPDSTAAKQAGVRKRGPAPPPPAGVAPASSSAAAAAVAAVASSGVQAKSLGSSQHSSVVGVSAASGGPGQTSSPSVAKDSNRTSKSTGQDPQRIPSPTNADSDEFYKNKLSLLTSAVARSLAALKTRIFETEPVLLSSPQINPESAILAAKEQVQLEMKQVTAAVTSLRTSVADMTNPLRPGFEPEVRKNLDTASMHLARSLDKLGTTVMLLTGFWPPADASGQAKDAALEVARATKEFILLAESIINQRGRYRAVANEKLSAIAKQKDAYAFQMEQDKREMRARINRIKVEEEKQKPKLDDREEAPEAAHASHETLSQATTSLGSSGSLSVSTGALKEEKMEGNRTRRMMSISNYFSVRDKKNQKAPALNIKALALQDVHESIAEYASKIDTDDGLVFDESYTGSSRDSPGGAAGSSPNTPDTAEAPSLPLGRKQSREQLGLPSLHSASSSGLSKGYLRGGTVEKLIMWITSYRHEDVSFAYLFLQSHSSFMTSHQLLKMLTARFNFAPARSVLSDQQLLLVDQQILAPIRNRVYNFIKLWIEKQFEDFKLPANSGLQDALFEFLDKDMREVLPNEAFMLKKLFESKSGMRADAKSELFLQDAPHPILPLKKTGTLDLLDLDPLEVARQLTLIDYDLYSKIPIRECLKQGWAKSGDVNAPYITAMIKRFNFVTQWVSTEMMYQRTPKHRAIVLRHFILIAQKCCLLNNYNALKAILSGLTSASVHRLKKTWEAITKKARAVFNDLEEICSAENNFSLMRDSITKCGPPCVPWLGLYLRDLTFLDDGHPSELKISPNPPPHANGSISSNKEPLINFHKRRMMLQAAREALQYQNAPYCLREVPMIQDILLNEKGLLKSEAEQFKISLILEPKGS